MSEDDDFLAHFSCCVGVFLSLWGMFRTTDLMPAGGTFEHLLWTLMFIKIYGGQKPLCSLAGGINPELSRHGHGHLLMLLQAWNHLW